MQNLHWIGWNSEAARVALAETAEKRFSFKNIDHFQNASSLITRMTSDVNNVQNTASRDDAYFSACANDVYLYIPLAVSTTAQLSLIFWLLKIQSFVLSL